MSARHLAKISRYIPLWQRLAPRYPLWYKGNPQLRIHLPMFWMKMVKSNQTLPENVVKFEVHRQMTKYDVKNYLEKIYNVKVLSVRTSLRKPEKRFDQDRGHEIEPHDPVRVAFVQVADEHKFEFPDLFAKNQPEDAKQIDDAENKIKIGKNEQHKTWHMKDVPRWFQ